MSGTEHGEAPVVWSTDEWHRSADKLARLHAIILACEHCGSPVWHHQPFASRCTWCQKECENKDATPLEKQIHGAELSALRQALATAEKELDFAISQRESAFLAEDRTNGECSELTAERDDANAERDAALRAAEEANAAMMTMRDTVLAEVTERRDWFFARWQESKNAGYVELADKIHWKNEAEKLAKDSYANKSRALDAEEQLAETKKDLASALESLRGMREALAEAATSLRTIADQGGKDQLDTMLNVRGFANSRAIVAQQAITATSGGA